MPAESHPGRVDKRSRCWREAVVELVKLGTALHWRSSYSLTVRHFTIISTLYSTFCNFCFSVLLTANHWSSGNSSWQLHSGAMWTGAQVDVAAMQLWSQDSGACQVAVPEMSKQSTWALWQGGGGHRVPTILSLKCQEMWNCQGDLGGKLLTNVCSSVWCHLGKTEHRLINILLLTLFWDYFLRLVHY